MKPAFAIGHDVTMTKNEQMRLTVVEQQQVNISRDVAEIKAVVYELRDAYQRGKGAYWAFIKFGVVLASIASIAGVISTYLPIWLKH